MMKNEIITMPRVNLLASGFAGCGMGLLVGAIILFLYKDKKDALPVISSIGTGMIITAFIIKK